jgi:hypothetical protein
MPNLKKAPFVLDPDLFLLFEDLGQTRYQALVNALIVQRIARMQVQVKPKQLSLTTEELLELFCFVGPRTLKRCIFLLRGLGIWKNTKYVPKQGKKSYANIRISWKSIARLAKQVQGEVELKEMAKKLNE